MLYLNTGHAPRQTVQPGPHSGAEGAALLDLVLPTNAERSWAERATGLRVPAQADLAEVESSSRLAVSGQVLTLSTPITYLGPDGTSMVAPLGFVLSPDHLITVRFAEMPVFDLFARRFQGKEYPQGCSTLSNDGE
jgi:magnesium transporter